MKGGTKAIIITRQKLEGLYSYYKLHLNFGNIDAYSVANLLLEEIAVNTLNQAAVELKNTVNR